jgi:N-acetylglucosaminyldiphosphoundecaprenol N-acetyl-beta-D-mannosaminyltransferase
MYLRYGDPSWDAADATATATATSRLPGEAAGGAAGRSVAPASAPGRRRLPGVVLCNVLLHAITEAECVRHICDELDAGRGGMVVTPNLDHLRRYGNDVNFGALVAEAELVVADGMPLVWASRLQGTPLPERVAGSNLISSLSAAAAERGRSIYLLGGAPGTAVGAGEALRSRFPAVKVVGTYCPPFGFDKDPKGGQ